MEIYSEEYRKELNVNVFKEIELIKKHLDSEYVKKEYEKCLKIFDVEKYLSEIKDLYRRVRGLFYI